MKRILGFLAGSVWLPALLCGQPATLPGTTPLTLSGNIGPNHIWFDDDGTQPKLTVPGDLASNMVAGVDRFLLRKIDESATNQERFWHRDLSSPAAYNQSIETNRQRLACILGVRDARPAKVEMHLMATTTQSALVGHGSGFDAYAVCWPAFGDVHGEGLLLVPTGQASVANVIAIPDANQTPEQLAGLAPGIAPASQFARRLAESGCQVLIPVLIGTAGLDTNQLQGIDVDLRRGMPPLKTLKSLSHREFIYRPAFVMGRHVIGYEIEKVLAGVDWMTQETNSGKIGVIGWGEGGLLAFYAGALDTRISAVCVSGYFDDRRDIWRQPIYRNVFGLLEGFGDAEVAAMVAPRSLVVEAARGPEIRFRPGGIGAPGRLVTPELANVRSEFERARGLVAGLNPASDIQLVVSGENGRGPFGSERALTAFLSALGSQAGLAALGPAPRDLRTDFDPSQRQAEQIHELDRHTQWLLGQGPQIRRQFMAGLDTSSPEAFQRTSQEYRDICYRDVIGRFDDHLLPFNARSCIAYDTPKWTGYEVELDVYPDVMACGFLLLPKDLKPGENRPVVVCQHGWNSHAQEVFFSGNTGYHDFAARLCEQGFIVFAPQNPYIFGERYRTFQRKANPLGKSLYSIIIAQQQQITDWLKTLPFVEPSRIGCYGLSYGGRTAVVVPAVVTNYCLSICAGNFTDWVLRTATTRSSYSYVWGNSYEMFDWDLGSTFNYAEMVDLIAPRPFMVERGHNDPVATDATVASEFAKVRYFYEARLGLKDQCVIEYFNGPHEIHGVGTFAFLHQHLNWPKH
ncbi:MAG TPA: prolyl oligopeptidase family serine peptidase [Candidatus Sulfotelmatobacter sp.]|nr:prolyl oligopeptidase family serine peptidase [Candidatus Sulfotelmatobacter sp.]